ncbi:MAG: hypothetical protein Q9218_000065 [Villophora microphyllina]
MSIEHIVLIRILPGKEIQHTALMPLFDIGNHLTMDSSYRYASSYLDKLAFGDNDAQDYSDADSASKKRRETEKEEDIALHTSQRGVKADVHRTFYALNTFLDAAALRRMPSARSSGGCCMQVSRVFRMYCQEVLLVTDGIIFEPCTATKDIDNLQYPDWFDIYDLESYTRRKASLSSASFLPGLDFTPTLEQTWSSLTIMARHSSPSQLSLTNILQNNLDDIRNTVRDITQLFVNTAALLPDGETTQDHKKCQREEAENVERDKASPRGLFDGRFKPSAYRPPIRDDPDGVDRCPMCTWELEAGMCNSCGYTTLNHIPFGDDDGSANTDSDMYSSMDSAELEEVLADPNNAHALAFDSDDPELNQQPPRLIEAMRRRGTWSPIHRRRHRVWPRRPRSDDDEGSSDETGSVGSLGSFVDDDPDVDVDNATLPEIDFFLSDSEPTSSINETHSEPSVALARRRVRRRQVATASPEPSDSGFSTVTQSSHRSSPQSSGSAPTEQDPEGPIQVDSDSDAPPPRRPRRRRAALSISSDEEEDNDRREINPSRSRTTSRSSSEETARRGGRPPPSSAARRNRRPRRPRSPILIDSSPAPPDTSHSGGPRPVAQSHRGARHQRLLSEITFDESVDDETSTNEQPRITHRNVLTDENGQEATNGQRPRPHIVDLRELPEQLHEPVESQTSASQPTPEQRQQARTRLKQERRRRRQREIASRQRAHPMGPSRQLAYIGV